MNYKKYLPLIILITLTAIIVSLFQYNRTHNSYYYCTQAKPGMSLAELDALIGDHKPSSDYKGYKTVIWDNCMDCSSYHKAAFDKNDKVIALRCDENRLSFSLDKKITNFSGE